MKTHDQRDQILNTLDFVGDVAATLAAKGGGMLGAGALAVASLAKTTALAMRTRNQDVDEILATIRDPRNLVMPWNK